MPPSEKVARADLVSGAVAVVEKEGLAALTARRVAAELQVSTAPVYRHFESMEELARAAMESAGAALLGYASKPYTGRPFLDMGTGVALFARDHPRLYRALFLETDQFGELVKRFLEQLTDDMARDPLLAKVERATRALLLDRMWTYTHGLASLIAVGLAKDSGRDFVIRSLDAVGTAVIRDVLPGRRE